LEIILGLEMAKLNDKHSAQTHQLQARVLEEMLKRPENKECIDCGSKGPRWASVNIGVFLCIRCSGVHRSMGTHISKVKSVTLDKWTQEQIELFSKKGNDNVRAIYEANVPSNYRRPNENDNYGVEQWIRDKYERKIFINKEVHAGPPAGGERRKLREESKPVKAPANQQTYQQQTYQQPHQAQQAFFDFEGATTQVPHNTASFHPVHNATTTAPPRSNASSGAGVGVGQEFANFKSAPPANKSDFTAFQQAPKKDPIEDLLKPATEPAKPVFNKDSLMSLYNMPPMGTPPPGYGYPPTGYPHAGYPGYPPTGYPPAGYTGYPPTGYPPAGYSGYPPTGYPPAGYSSPYPHTVPAGYFSSPPTTVTYNK